MNIEIDPKAGFCFGVTRVVNKAEEIIKKQGFLYCLGEIVHNQKEIERLENLGLKTITHREYLTLSDCSVLIRAHGEPPETYTYAQQHHIELIDGTCPIVLRLQSKIKHDFDDNDSGTQIVIYGKKDHAEVIGLAGQTSHRAIIVESSDDINKIDFSRPVHLYAQTTMSSDKYHQLQDMILQKAAMEGAENKDMKCNNSICQQVAGRIPQLKEFSEFHDVVLFVSYKQSSNGKLLFSKCKEVNDRTYFVTETSDVKSEWLTGASNIGITGATSTPRWLLEEFAACLRSLEL
jgi:4-hydroxy-3-methylbut-2-enyl diphosphate reductase